MSENFFEEHKETLKITVCVETRIVNFDHPIRLWSALLNILNLSMSIFTAAILVFWRGMWQEGAGLCVKPHTYYNNLAVSHKIISQRACRR